MALTTEKRCSVCREVRPVEDFHKLASASDGRMCRCKGCVRKKNNAYYARNREAVKAQVKTWRAKNPEKVKAIGRAYVLKRDKDVVNRRSRKLYDEMHPQKKRDIRLRSKYGITVERYDEMIEAQGGVCAICHRGARLVVDHNHDTGEVRGLLCHGCNSALGMLRESPRACLNMVDYIERHSAGDNS